MKMETSSNKKRYQAIHGRKYCGGAPTCATFYLDLGAGKRLI